MFADWLHKHAILLQTNARMVFLDRIIDALTLLIHSNPITQQHLSPSPYTPINVMRSSESCGERANAQIYCKCCYAAVLLQLCAEIICFAVFAGVQLSAALLTEIWSRLIQPRVHKHEAQRRRALKGNRMCWSSALWLRNHSWMEFSKVDAERINGGDRFLFVFLSGNLIFVPPHCHLRANLSACCAHRAAAATLLEIISTLN